jgi:small subunit ribosomal protein S1
MLRAMADESFAALMEQNRSGGAGGRRLRAGEVIEAKVIQISGDAVFVDVGTPSDGHLSRSEFEDRDGNIAIKVGQTIKATVMDPRPDGPVLSVSLGRRGSIDLSALELAKSSGVAVVGKVERAVKGGLELSLGGVSAFCPASQVEIGYAAELEGYVGQELEFRVLEIREGGRSIVVSRRSLHEDKRREAASELLGKLVPGAELEGTVTSFNKHGAVIDLGGLDGFAHISELGRRVQRPEDALELGEKVNARLISVEDGPKGPRIKLSLKSQEGGSSTAPATAPDEVLKAQVIASNSAGVTVNTPKGEGFVPMRELGLPQGADHRRAFPAGKEFDVVVLSQGGGRLRLSAMQVARVEERRNFRDYSGGGGAPGTPAAGFGSLGDVLRKKLGLPAEEAPRAEPKPEPVKARAAEPPSLPRAAVPDSLPRTAESSPPPSKHNDAVIRRNKR